MVLQEIRNIKSNRSELRKFGITIGIVLGLIGGVLFLKGRGNYPVFLSLCAVFFFLALTVPVVLKVPHKVWMSLSVILGWFVSRVILTILFFLVITPIGLLAKLFGKDFLNRKLEKGKGSYWISRELSKAGKGCYERQF